MSLVQVFLFSKEVLNVAHLYEFHLLQFSSKGGKGEVHFQLYPHTIPNLLNAIRSGIKLEGGLLFFSKGGRC